MRQDGFQESPSRLTAAPAQTTLLIINRGSHHPKASIDDLLAIGARLASEREFNVRSLGHSLLAARPDGGGFGGVSQLNNDGTPVQLCLSSSPERIGVRLIVDPAWQLSAPAERYEASLCALNEACERAGAVAMRPLCQTMLDVARPDDERIVNQFTRGFFWIGVGVGQHGLAVYLDTKPYGDSAWELATLWLEQILPGSPSVRPLLSGLSRLATLASIGIEGKSPVEARAKLYWRLNRPVRLDTLGADLLGDAALSAFLTHVVGQRAMRLSGTVLSLGFKLATGEIEDAKIDLCGHCLVQSPASWLDTLDHLSEMFGLQRFPVLSELLEGHSEVAFLGLGIDRHGGRRLNLYLKPPGLGKTSDPHRRLDAAVEYLLDLQQPDGSWHDYQLPVGRATQWVTAFVGLALAQASAANRLPEARAAAERAAEWLTRTRAYPAGWGYNEKTGVDADSTGLVLRLLRAVGYAVEPRDEQRLLAQWREGGGFAAYNSPHYWGAAHPCVTAVAFMALSSEDRRRLSSELEEYLRRVAQPDGTWPAYWWRTHFYSTYHFMVLLRRLGLQASFSDPVGELATPDDVSAFDLAYAVGIEHLRAPSSQGFAELLARLLERQRADGSWCGGYNLRVTDPSCAQPWIEPQGQLYRDIFGTITTASAVMILSEVTND